MRYILNNGSMTSNVKSIVRDSILLGFLTDPRDIKYDKLPSINTDINNPDRGTRDALINERVRSLINRISSSIGKRIDISRMDIQLNEINIELKVENETITITV